MYKRVKRIHILLLVLISLLTYIFLVETKTEYYDIVLVDGISKKEYASIIESVGGKLEAVSEDYPIVFATLTERQVEKIKKTKKVDYLFVHPKGV